MKNMVKAKLSFIASAVLAGLMLITTAGSGMLIAAPETKAEAGIKIRTEHFRIEVDGKGSLSGLIAEKTGQDYLPADRPVPILQVRVDGKFHAPDRMDWEKVSDRMTLSFDETDIKVVLGVKTKSTHLTFEVLEAQPIEKVELILWGPYPTTINRTIGELVGVVRDQNFGIGIQVLNPKTMGGYPTSENDIMPVWTETDQNYYKESWLTRGTQQRMWGETAKRTDVGSILQSYCRNRPEDREITISAFWMSSHHRYMAPAYDDGGVIGSSIALFGCPEPEIMTTLEAIELAEGLPHPTTADGRWAKSVVSAPTLLLVDFTEDNFEHTLGLAKRAGVDFIYSRGAFQTWGHWQLNPKKFPNGRAGLKACVDRAKSQGVGVGLHMLCFVSAGVTQHYGCTSDEYVTKGDSRLAAIGHSALVKAVDASATSIPIVDPTYFQFNSTLNTIRIGSELVRFGSVSTEEPWQLLNCTRGAWGSKAASHDKGETVSRLADHIWNCLLPNPELSVEMARNMADLCNETGITRVAFDGLEGNFSTGLGQYGQAQFITAWYNALGPELKGKIWNDGSQALPFNWHAHTHFSWGEMDGYDRTSAMALYRVAQQAYFSRNYLPRSLGFYSTNPQDTAANVEFMLAQSAGFDAGFCIELGGYTSGPNLEPMLDAVRVWQEARLAGAFPEVLKPLLQNPLYSFHLESHENGKWKLYPVNDRDGRCEPIIIPVAGPLDKETLDRFVPPKDLLKNRPASSASDLIGAFPPANACDGNTNLGSSWWAEEYPAWLSVELEELTVIDCVRVYPYWGAGRYYQYTVDVSADGETWTQVGDMSKNTTPSTPDGDRFKFDPVEARHVRVNMLYHNLNKGVHIVEVKAFEKQVNE